MTATNYREFECKPTSTGGVDHVGTIHRLYDVAPAGADRRELMQAGWRAVDLSSGCYAHTSICKEALKISMTGMNLVWVKLS